MVFEIHRVSGGGMMVMVFRNKIKSLVSRYRETQTPRIVSYKTKVLRH